MTTTLTITYTSGNGVIEVQKPSETIQLSSQGETATIDLHQGEGQVVTVKEVGFVAAAAEETAVVVDDTQSCTSCE